MSYNCKDSAERRKESRIMDLKKEKANQPAE